MKECVHCHKTKKIEFFRKNKSRKDGLSSYCKKCSLLYDRSFYQKTREKRLTLKKKNSQAIADRNTRLIMDYLLIHPCISCGESDPIVLEFDHRRPEIKKSNISNLISGHSIKEIIEEIKKCDVFCANCHRRKTSRQFGNRKLFL